MLYFLWIILNVMAQSTVIKSTKLIDDAIDHRLTENATLFEYGTLFF